MPDKVIIQILYKSATGRRHKCVNKVISPSLLSKEGFLVIMAQRGRLDFMEPHNYFIAAKTKGKKCCLLWFSFTIGLAF